MSFRYLGRTTDMARTKAELADDGRFGPVPVWWSSTQNRQSPGGRMSYAITALHGCGVLHLSRA